MTELNGLSISKQNILRMGLALD